MANKGPKTAKGKARKLLSGSGTKKVPGEEPIIAVMGAMSAAEEAIKGSSGSKKRNPQKRTSKTNKSAGRKG